MRLLLLLKKIIIIFEKDTFNKTMMYLVTTPNCAEPIPVDFRTSVIIYASNYYNNRLIIATCINYNIF
jgi:hypothetical protein